MGSQAQAAASAALNSLALQTMGACPEWDAKVTEYLSWSARSQMQDICGATVIAESAYKAEIAALELSLGKSWRDHPVANARARSLYEALLAEEEKLAERFYNPLWDAQRELMTTPAPTLAAAMFKVSLTAHHDIGNDSQLGDDCPGIVDADLARLGAIFDPAAT